MDANKAIQNPENVCFNCLKETTVHKIEIPDLGWGSQFDNFSTRIQLCDYCYKATNPSWWKLKVIHNKEFCYTIEYYEECYEYEDEILDFVNRMPLAGQELFHNRFAKGACAYPMQPQDWIDFELGIMSHEKCQEYGFISPKEEDAYNTRFPKCQHVVNLLFTDGSKGCWCPFGAYGEDGQKAGENICSECYECKYYEERHTPIKDILEADWEDYIIYCTVKLREKDLEKKFG